MVRAQLERARAVSESEAFDLALQHGQSLTLDAAVALAQSLIEAANDAQQALVLG